MRRAANAGNAGLGPAEKISKIILTKIGIGFIYISILLIIL